MLEKYTIYNKLNKRKFYNKVRIKIRLLPRHEKLEFEELSLISLFTLTLFREKYAEREIIPFDLVLLFGIYDTQGIWHWNSILPFTTEGGMEPLLTNQ